MVHDGARGRTRRRSAETERRNRISLPRSSGPGWLFIGRAPKDYGEEKDGPCSSTNFRPEKLVRPYNTTGVQLLPNQGYRFTVTCGLTWGRFLAAGRAFELETRSGDGSDAKRRQHMDGGMRCPSAKDGTVAPVLRPTKRMVR